MVQPLGDGRIGAVKEAPVRVLVQEGPGNDRDAARPGYAVVVDRPVGGADVGNRAVVPLRVGHVLDPLGVERVVPEEVGLAPGLGRAVAQPPLPLVALRAVGRDASVVAAHAPDDVTIDAVEQGIGAGELAGGLQVVADDAALDRVGAGGSRVPGELDVPEPVQREARLVGLEVAAPERVDIRDLRAAQVVHVEHAVVAQPFREAHPHLLARRALHAQTAPSCEVLAHVVHEYPGLHLLHRHRLHRARDADGVDHGGRHDAGGRLHQLRLLPRGVVKSRLGPSLELLPGVVFLAVVFVVGDDRPVGAQLPGLVAEHVLGAAVVVFEVKLEQKPGSAEGLRFRLGEPGRVEPAVSEHDPDGVPALPERRGDVVGHVEHALSVVAQGRRQSLVAYLLPVEIQLGPAQPGIADGRAADFPLGREFLPQPARGEATGSVGGRPGLPFDLQPDPLRLPVHGLQQTHGPLGGTAPARRIALVVPDAHLPVTGAQRAEGLPLVGHVDGVRCVDLAAVPEVAVSPLEHLGGGRHHDLVGRLARAAAARVDDPAQPRLGHVYALGIDQVFAAEISDRRGPREGRPEESREGDRLFRSQVSPLSLANGSHPPSRCPSYSARCAMLMLVSLSSMRAIGAGARSIPAETPGEVKNFPSSHLISRDRRLRPTPPSASPRNPGPPRRRSAG